MRREKAKILPLISTDDADRKKQEQTFYRGSERIGADMERKERQLNRNFGAPAIFLSGGVRGSPGIQSSHFSHSQNWSHYHGRQQTQIDLARHVPVFAGIADGICGDEVYQSADGAGGASGRRDEWDISYCAGRGVDGSAPHCKTQSRSLLDCVVWSLRKLGSDGAGSGLGNRGAFSDYQRGTSCHGLARDICYSGLYVCWAGDCGIGRAGAVGIAAWGGGGVAAIGAKEAVGCLRRVGTRAEAGTEGSLDNRDFISVYCHAGCAGLADCAQVSSRAGGGIRPIRGAGNRWQDAGL